MSTNPANQIPSAAQWESHLRRLISGVISDVPFDATDPQKHDYIDRFVDELGNRRATDRPFLAALLGVRLDELSEPGAIDEELWWMIEAGLSDPDQAMALVAPRGGLFRDAHKLAIEYRTMVELCALHALWTIARRGLSGALIERCLDAAAWHTRELQPDNGINRPWAAHVFIELSLRSGDPETRHTAHLHAQTLVHNCSVSFGAPDLLSALILKDAADHLSDPG